jgi:hypothetical protein
MTFSRLGAWHKEGGGPATELAPRQLAWKGLREGVFRSAWGIAHGGKSVDQGDRQAAS